MSPDIAPELALADIVALAVKGYMNECKEMEPEEATPIVLDYLFGYDPESTFRQQLLNELVPVQEHPLLDTTSGRREAEELIEQKLIERIKLQLGRCPANHS